MDAKPVPSEVDTFREYVSKQADTYLGQPAAEQEIAEFEARYGVKLPADVREYFLKINGVYVSGGFITLEALSKWSLIVEYEYGNPEHIKQILDEAEKYFRFGSYDILVWDWLIKLGSNPDVETPIVVIHGSATKVADNLTDFFQKYHVMDPESLLGP